MLTTDKRRVTDNSMKYMYLGKKKNKGSNSVRSVVVDPEPEPESDDSSGSQGPENDTEFAYMLTGTTQCRLRCFLFQTLWIFR